MSTYWGYVCKSHDPNLESEHWFNHGEATLAQAYHSERAGTWPDADIGHEHWAEPQPVEHRAYATTAPIEWLRLHPRCTVALRNEYGDECVIPPTPPEVTP